MANHSFVHTSKLSVSEAEGILREHVKFRLGDSFVVSRRQDLEAKYNTPIYRAIWFVGLPGTGLDAATAMSRMKAPDDNYGFIVYLQRGGRALEFRHPMNAWEWWAQALVQNSIAEALEATMTDDGDDKEESGDPSQFKRTFREYLYRNFPAPTPSDEAFLQRQLDLAPEGFRA
jgi:hypothetical protein